MSMLGGGCLCCDQVVCERTPTVRYRPKSVEEYGRGISFTIDEISGHNRKFPAGQTTTGVNTAALEKENHE